MYVYIYSTIYVRKYTAHLYTQCSGFFGRVDPLCWIGKTPKEGFGKNITWTHQIAHFQPGLFSFSPASVEALLERNRGFHSKISRIETESPKSNIALARKGGLSYATFNVFGDDYIVKDMYPWKFEKNHFFCRDPIVGSKGWIKQMFLEFSKKPLVASPCVDRGKKQPTRRSISNWHSAVCTPARVRCFVCSRETLPRNHQKFRGFFQLKLLHI